VQVVVEACVDTVDGARAAEAGGADRVELCAGLVEGGTTPSVGAISLARERLSIPIFVIVRPRAGDFLYSENELTVMQRDIAAAASAGADGVVLGVLTPDGRVDGDAMRHLVPLARPMSVTFHRAVDLTRDLEESLDALIDAGVDRVLTSGGAASAVEGIGTIASLVQRAAERIVVMAGGGITASNAARVVAETGVREIHVRGSSRVPSTMEYKRAGVACGKPYTPDEYARTVTDEQRIRDVVDAARAARH
jgi:copper homeostasis protein